MCNVTDIVLEVKMLTDKEVYSLRTFSEIRDTFKKEDVLGIENSDGYYVNASGRYKICSSDAELLSFCYGGQYAKSAMFACSNREAMQYLAGLVRTGKFAYMADF